MKTAKRMLVAIAVGLSGCGTTPPADEIFKPDSPTMAEIVERATHGKTDEVILKSHFGRSYGGDLESYTRTQDNELSSLFPVMDNPRINVYVFPHITMRGDPVPGYTTAFYLYTKSGQFALPGEFYEQPLEDE